MSLVTNLQTAFTAVATQIKALRVMITGTSTGTLASLSTTDKSSIIAAINEVSGIAGTGVTSVNGTAGPGAIVIDTDDVAEGSTNIYFTGARTRSTLLTGYASSAGILSATDSILVGFNKLNGNLAALTTTNVAEGTNLYYTNARGIASTLTGYSAGAGTVAATDSILQAIQKVDGNVSALTTTVVAEGTNLYYTNARGIASTLTSFASTTGTITSADTVLGAIQKLYGNANAITTTVVAEGTNLYYTNARGIASTLTGYTSGAGTVAATDTVLQAIQKLNGNAAALINDTTATTSNVYSSSKTDSQIATAVSNLVASSPAALDTLNELATALGNDPAFATTITTSIGLKANSTDVFTKVEIGTDAVTHDFSADFAAGLV